MGICIKQCKGDATTSFIIQAEFEDEKEPFGGKGANKTRTMKST